MTRRQTRGLLIGLALAGAAFVGAAVYFMKDDKGGMTAQGGLFLARLVDGMADDAYDNADPALRDILSRAELTDLAQDVFRVSGRFRKLENVKIQGHTLTADALFERSTIAVSYELVKSKGIWRVAAFELTFPDGIWGQPDPAPLLADATAFGDAFVAGDLAKMYNRFTPAMHKALKPSQFEGDIQKLRNGCATLSIGKPGVLTDSAETGLTIVAAHVLCEPRGSFILRTKWSFARGRWRLLGFAWTE